MREQRRSYVAEFHAYTADLNLGVAAPDKFQLARFAEPHEVTGPVHAPATLGGDETFGSQSGASAVTPGQPGPAEVQLAEAADGDSAQPGVEHEGVDVVQGAADRDGAARDERIGEGRENGRLRGPVRVEHAATR